ncbi:MAG: phytoene desaturase family protein, partial [Actinomycetota bacterium]
YSYLVESDPPLEEITGKGLLDGYILDLGFHGVSMAGEGYFAMLRELLGGFGGREVVIEPFLTGAWLEDRLVDVNIPTFSHMSIDPILQSELDRLGRTYFDFFGDLSQIDLGKALSLRGEALYDYLREIDFVKSSEELERLDSVSLSEHLSAAGLADSKLVRDYFRCICTLFTTINNPDEISMGDILRYAAQVIIPATLKGGGFSIGGYVQDGVMEWSKALAGRLEDLGGQIRLNSRVTGVEIEDGRAIGVKAESEDGEEFIPSARVIMSTPVQDLFEYVERKNFAGYFVQMVDSLYGYGSLSPYFGLSELPLPEEHAERLMLAPCVVPREEGFDWDVYMAWGIQSYIEPSCAPAGKHLFTAYLPLTEEESRDRELAMKVARAVPDFLESIYPGFKDCIEWALYPVCVKLEGVAKSVTQAGSLKPEVKAPGVEGLYFAGDTARGYGVAMDCACSSGIICASEITGADYGI